MDADPASSQSQEEIAILKDRFDEAINFLKTADKRGNTNSLYELPWYIIIGPPGSGKTTALINSGLRFPLAERFGKEALQGVGGTRNCDWWITDDAVMIDTAGRYVTQDSYASVDSAAWEGFLDLLKNNRTRRPINGAIIAISLADLAVQSEAKEISIYSPSSSVYRNYISILVSVFLSMFCSRKSILLPGLWSSSMT